jgi:hypothetical protein
VDHYRGPAHLEWWANPSTCLSDVTVVVTFAASPGAEWNAQATLAPPLVDEEREAFDFLMTASPFFTLRLPNDSSITVAVEAVDGGLHLTLDKGDPPDKQPTRINLA